VIGKAAIGNWQLATGRGIAGDIADIEKAGLPLISSEQTLSPQINADERRSGKDRVIGKERQKQIPHFVRNDNLIGCHNRKLPINDNLIGCHNRKLPINDNLIGCHNGELPINET
jgi:hypothetical protein